MRETMPADFEAQPTPRRRVVVDTSINVATMAALLGVLASGIGAWTALDKRVVVLEEAKTYQAARDAGQDAVIREKFETIKETTGRIDRALDDMRRDQLDARYGTHPFGQPKDAR